MGRFFLSTPMSFLRGSLSFEIRISIRKTIFPPVRGRMSEVVMSFLGTLHEISFYGLLTNIICIITKLTTKEELIFSATHVSSFQQFFLSYLFWATVLFFPIAIIGAFATKYGDFGEGLSFNSNNIVVIIFAHIGEELLGLVLSPFWFLRDLFRKSWSGGKIADYIVYVILILFILYGLMTLGLFQL